MTEEEQLRQELINEINGLDLQGMKNIKRSKESFKQWIKKKLAEIIDRLVDFVVDAFDDLVHSISNSLWEIFS
jgi:hypothetical protein